MERSRWRTCSVFGFWSIRSRSWAAPAYFLIDSIVPSFQEIMDANEKVCVTVIEYETKRGRACFGILFQKAQLMVARGNVLEEHLHFVMERR